MLIFDTSGHRSQVTVTAVTAITAITAVRAVTAITAITAVRAVTAITAVKSVLIKGVVEYLQRYMLYKTLVLIYIILGL